MRIIGIDPGPETSGLVELEVQPDWLDWLSSGRFTEPPDGVRLNYGVNDATLLDLRMAITATVAHPSRDIVAVEWLTSYGGSVGQSTFATAATVGRVLECTETRSTALVVQLTRPQCARLLCGSASVKGDAPLSLACRELVVQTGGGKKPAVGTKARPGPLYGLTGPHAWSALHVAMAALIRRGEKR
jgi:hypothetical protein